jgi:adenosine deaminase
METREFIRSLPKAELHLHIEGSLEPEMLMVLARRNRVEIPFRLVAEVRAAYEFTELQDFLDIYYRGMSVLREAEDFEALTLAYMDRAAADGIAHVEIFYDPQGHTARGIPFAVATDGILAGLAEGGRRHGITSRLILCFLRHLSEEDGFATFREAEPWFADGRIVGVGLDSTERGNPPAKFARLFQAARDAGLKLVAHAGEEGTAADVRDAVDILKLDRIRAGRQGPGRTAGVGAHGADRLPAVERQAVRRARYRRPPLEAHARCRPLRHRQFRRPVLFRRLSWR